MTVRPFIARRRAPIPTTSWKRASSTTWRPSISRSKRLGTMPCGGWRREEPACSRRPALVGPVPFADLRTIIGNAETALEALTPDEVNGWAGKELDLQIGPRRLAFTSETLILSFSLPNFHFHAVTAYDILRSRGVPLGKRDYEGSCAPDQHEPKFAPRARSQRSDCC